MEWKNREVFLFEERLGKPVFDPELRPKGRFPQEKRLPAGMQEATSEIPLRATK